MNCGAGSQPWINSSWTLSPSFSRPKKKQEPTQPKSVLSHPHRNKRYVFTNLIGDYHVILNWLRLICAALPKGRVSVLLV
jgi:hypothetical protein